MQPISVAFLWHQHQPYYPDDVSGQTLLPWVRLHGTKDYIGMALQIKDVPEFRCTINLVPSLLVQLLAYAEQGKSDRHLDVSRMPADGLAEEDLLYLLDHFFMANLENMIRPFPRYYELYLKRGLGVDPAKKAATRFSEQDLRDLQVWSNLTWIHPLVFEQDGELQQFRSRGRFWNEAEKTWLLKKQLEILGRIIPLHRELAASGQVELTTTPFYHPILPLLWDKRSTRQAMPGCHLPKHLDAYQRDAQQHLDRAVAFHAEQFGARPVGMWPSEGSVSQDIIGAIADAGITWIATDEEILAESTEGWVARDPHGHARRPEMLFRPWRVSDGQRDLQIVFRDHALSDLIGFHYQRTEPKQAVDDLLGRLEAIKRAVSGHMANRPALVPIILDGENCWEYYPDGGVEFLHGLYRECASRATIRPTRMRDYLFQFPATDKISRLFAGSWISHNFSIWIGHDEDNTAWDLLHRTREYLLQAEADGRATGEVLRRAWEEIYIAEGSDWFWWFGDDHSSPQDSLFDQLFRQHLRNVYRLIGDSWPHELDQPIKKLQSRAIHTQPSAFLAVKVNGRTTFFEWVNAGHFVSGSERGTMALVTPGLICKIFFGFDSERLMLRFDTANRAIEDLSGVDELRVRFLEPEGTEIRVHDLFAASPAAALLHNHRTVEHASIDVAIREIVELTVSFADLKVQPDQSIKFSIEAISSRKSIDRAPSEGVIELTVPSPDFEMRMWQV